MSKRLIINSLAVMFILIGGVSFAAKSSAPMMLSTCSSGGVSCDCGAGHSCSANSNGVCTCGT